MVHLHRMTLVALVCTSGACGGAPSESEWKPVEASIFRIDRTCASKTTVQETGKPTELVSSIHDCQMNRSFLDTVRRQAGRADFVHGTSTVKVTYLAPQDQTQHIAQLKFDSAADQFYTLKAGDKINIRVSVADPDKIRLD